MRIGTRSEGNDRIVVLCGQLEAHAARELSEAIREATKGLAGDLIIDMGGVDFLGSAGLGVLVAAHNSMAENAGELRIIKVQPFVKRVFELCNLSRLVDAGAAMFMRIWGARGSLPTPLAPPEIERKIRCALQRATPEDLRDQEAIQSFVEGLPALERGTAGGNTACVEIRAGERLLILDAGSGVRALGQLLMGEGFATGNGLARFLMTHTHWDHIMGFPFFAPAYVPGNHIEICGAHPGLEDRFRGQQVSQYFPVRLEDMAADISFRILDPAAAHDLDGVTVRVARMKHPGGSFSYRVEFAGKSIVYATDVEFHDVKAEIVDRHVDFFADADVLIFDSQYSVEETVAKQDWGHSSPIMGADIAAEAGVKRLLMFHHEPTATDEDLARSLEKTRGYLQHLAPNSGCTVDLAQEGLDLWL